MHSSAILQNPTTYVATDWTGVSGGLSPFNPAATLGTIRTAPMVYNWVLTILQDSTLTVALDSPASSDCAAAGDSCQAFLVNGGLKTIAPWPWQFIRESGLDNYMLRNIPSYQVDVWDLDSSAPYAWQESDCHIYGSVWRPSRSAWCKIRCRPRPATARAPPS